jgi:large subunit ribosomal protein L6
MSRIGKAPIAIPAGVTISVSDKNVVTVKGPKGELTQQVDSDITVKEEDGNILVTRPTEQKRHKSLHGLYRSLINNMVVGVTEGYKTTQELVGVGYRASSTGNTLELALGFSHPIVFVLPAEVKVSTTAEKGKNPTVTLESSEQLRRKAGKSAKK